MCLEIPIWYQIINNLSNDFYKALIFGLDKRIEKIKDIDNAMKFLENNINNIILDHLKVFFKIYEKEIIYYLNENNKNIYDFFSYNFLFIKYLYENYKISFEKKNCKNFKKNILSDVRYINYIFNKKDFYLLLDFNEQDLEKIMKIKDNNKKLIKLKLLIDVCIYNNIYLNIYMIKEYCDTTKNYLICNQLYKYIQYINTNNINNI